MDNAEDKSLLQRVADITPLIKEDSAWAELNGTLSEPVLEAILKARLFRLFIPKFFAGEEVDLPTALKVFEKVASADGATGWLVMIGAGGGLFSGFLPEQSAREIFEPDNAVIAGSGMPNGQLVLSGETGEASGRWAYASGSDYATWFTANCVVNDDSSNIRAIAVPAHQVDIDKTWDVLGMRATGSHDFIVTQKTVSKEFTFSLAEAPLRQETIFKYPLEVLASLSFVSVALGITQHALQAFTNYAQQKTLNGTEQTLHDEPAIQSVLAMTGKQVDSNRQRLYDLAEMTWERLSLDSELDEAFVQRISQQSSEIVVQCIQAADALKLRAGMMAASQQSEFGRAWRDLHTLSQHSIVAIK